MWIKTQILETGREGSCVSSIYQQGNYTWQLVLCEMMSYLGRSAKTSPPSRVVFPAMLFVCLLFKNHTCITLTYSWLCDGIVQLLDTQIMQITKWRGGKNKEVCSRCVYFRNRSVLRAPALGQAISLTIPRKYVAVIECTPSYSVTIQAQVDRLGDDMCYFACKFFSDSPPSEPTESDSGAGLKTEVCFYD